MNKGFNFLAFILTILIGSALVLIFTWFTGNYYKTPLLPVLSMLTGFITTGFIIGIITREITITEPGLGSMIVAVIAYFVLNSLEIIGLMDLADSDWIIILMNAVIMTFIGAWLGEKIQHGQFTSAESTTPSIDWGWVIAGALFGLTLTIIIVNILVFIIGPNPDQFIIPFFVGLLLTGIVVGKKSPGVTIKEAGISGFLTITILFDIVTITLYVDQAIPTGYVIGGIVLGIIVTLLGGFIGEKWQASSEKK